MAVLVKTLRELNDNERLPRNVDEIRRSLSQKLEALVAEEEAEVSRGPGPR
ncbi:MAG TPA: hypothetical protein VFX37_06640 [Pseudolabrys sp.]|nr:hypothetical protein [Pseudolabrys sp.]